MNRESQGGGGSKGVDSIGGLLGVTCCEVMSGLGKGL